MRKALATQIRQTSDVCFFCAIRLPREVPSLRTKRHVSAQFYSTSTSKRYPPGAAAAVRQDDEEEDEFPLLRENAATESQWPISKPTLRGRPLPTLPKAVENQDNNSPRYSQNRKEPQLRFRRDWNSHGERQPFRMNRFNRSPQGSNEAVGQKDNNSEGGSFRIKKFFVASDRTPQPDSDGTAKPVPGTRAQDYNRSKRNEIKESQQLRDNDRPNVRQLDLSASFPEEPEDNMKSGTREYRPLFVDSDPSIPVERIQPDAKRSTTTQNIQAAERRGEVGEVDEDAVQIPSWKTRFSSRFADDEEDEVPVAKPSSKGRSDFRVFRNRTADVDLEMLETEQALNGETRRKKKKKERRSETATRSVLAIPEFMSVQQLAQAMKIKVEHLVTRLEDEGFEGARYDHILDAETCTMFADMFGFEPITATPELQDLVARPPPEDVSSLPLRPPIVTIMGHVDHGKTTILDWLRKSSVAAGEHGGITQHIGAFSVTMPGTERQITFLDTPGHEAFLDMRRRGANVTDIVVLVVAADDSVKPQTIEAIRHALDAQVQIIVAINKVDKHDADVEKVKQDLTRHDIVVEDFGGDFQAVPVSGKTGQGMEDLEEAIVTLADVLDLRADQDGPAEGQIIESKVTNAGRVATILVKRGVLRVGDFIVAGPTWGRVRTLRNDAGILVKEAFPGDPVQVDGWRGEDPTAGLEVLQTNDEQHAKEVVELRKERAAISQQAAEITTINTIKTQEAEDRVKVLEWERENNIRRRHHDNEGWVDSAAKSGPKEVHFVVKADVAGSVEAIVAAVSSIGNHEIQANVVHCGTGPVVESDIKLLATSGEIAYAINFNQPVDPGISSLAHAAQLEILNHNIIYKVTDSVKQKVEDALPPLITQRVLGEAEVGKVFEITVKKAKIQIAGCKITNGTISRANKVRVLRNGQVIYTGTLESLKNVKRDVTEMRKGTECGMGFKDFEDVQEGDQVQCFEEKEEKRKLY